MRGGTVPHNILLLPLTGAFLVIHLAMLVVKVFALVDASTRPEPAFTYNDKQTKTFWVVVLALAVVSSFLGFLSIIGLVAALVYLVDVRPRVREFRRGGTSSGGPYGGW
jgi:uncharacterized membrane protein